MSHFTVLVIGNDPEKLLAPFNEEIEVAPYDDDELDPAKALQWAKDVLADPEKIRDTWRKPGESDAVLQKKLEEYRRVADLDPSKQEDAEKLLDWFGYPEDRRRRREDGSYVSLTTYNPESKWDWYALGGRWRGSLKVTPEAWARMTAKGKPGLGEKSWVFKPEWNDGQFHTDTPGWVDQCRKVDLDLQGMIDAKVTKGKEAVAALMDFISEHGSPPDATWLDKARADELSADEIAKARDAFWAHPWMQTNKKLSMEDHESKATVGGVGYWDLEDFRLVTENADGAERYLEIQRQRAIPGYAFLDEEHGWVEPGRMGWWGMSSDTAESRAKYYKERLAVVEAAPEDVLISVYDCHI